MTVDLRLYDRLQPGSTCLWLGDLQITGPTMDLRLEAPRAAAKCLGLYHMFQSSTTRYIR